MRKLSFLLQIQTRDSFIYTGLILFCVGLGILASIWSLLAAILAAILESLLEDFIGKLLVDASPLPVSFSSLSSLDSPEDSAVNKSSPVKSSREL